MKRQEIMRYKKMNNTGEEVSILGFGCMRFPTESDKIDKEESFKMMKYAYDMGINYYDTAYPYHNGESEKVLGEFLQTIDRSKVFVATKLPTWLINNEEDYEKYFNEQLEKLQTDYIDFYLIHTIVGGLWKKLKETDGLKFLDKKLSEGKIKHAGFSFHGGTKLFKEVIDSYHWEFCQIQYNYVDEEFQAGKEGLLYAYDKGVDTIIMEPLRGGSLTKVNEEIRNTLDKAEKKRSPAEWALRWLWNQKEVDLVLSGMSSMEQLKENIQIASEVRPNSLSDKEKNLINEVKSIYKQRTKVNCTACRYCMPCPSGVNIPLSFRQYNNAFMFDDIEKAKSEYLSVSKNMRASNCTECGECLSKCPQKIPIIDKLKEVVSLFGE
jgi:hypothetical protein